MTDFDPKLVSALCAHLTHNIEVDFTPGDIAVMADAILAVAHIFINPSYVPDTVVPVVVSGDCTMITLRMLDDGSGVEVVTAVNDVHKDNVKMRAIIEHIRAFATAGNGTGGLAPSTATLN